MTNKNIPRLSEKDFAYNYIKKTQNIKSRYVETSERV